MTAAMSDICRISLSLARRAAQVYAGLRQALRPFVQFIVSFQGTRRYELRFTGGANNFDVIYIESKGFRCSRFPYLSSRYVLTGYERGKGRVWVEVNVLKVSVSGRRLRGSRDRVWRGHTTLLIILGLFREPFHTYKVSYNFD